MWRFMDGTRDYPLGWADRFQCCHFACCYVVQQGSVQEKGGVVKKETSLYSYDRGFLKVGLRVLMHIQREVSQDVSRG